MAEVRIHDIGLVREEPEAPPAKVRLHDILLTHVPPPAPEPTVRIHDLWITRGFEPPSGGGGAYKRVGGTWVPLEVFVRFNGAWV